MALGVAAIAVSGYDPASAMGDAPSDTLEGTWKAALLAAGGNEHAALKSAARELGIKKPELRRRLAELGWVRD